MQLVLSPSSLFLCMARCSLRAPDTPMRRPLATLHGGGGSCPPPSSSRQSPKMPNMAISGVGGFLANNGRNKHASKLCSTHVFRAIHRCLFFFFARRGFAQEISCFARGAEIPPQISENTSQTCSLFFRDPHFSQHVSRGFSRRFFARWIFARGPLFSSVKFSLWEFFAAFRGARVCLGPTFGCRALTLVSVRPPQWHSGSQHRLAQLCLRTVARSSPPLQPRRHYAQEEGDSDAGAGS